MKAIEVDRMSPLPPQEPGTVARYGFRAVTTDDGSPVNVPVVVVAGQKGKPRVVFVAGVHGDEVQGIFALQSLLESLDPGRLNGTLVAVMCANPLAMRAVRRRAPQDDVDLNRVFPGDPSGSVSYRLAHALFEQLIPGADFVLTLHGWGSAGMVMPYAEYPAGDGNVCEASYQAARAFGLATLAPMEWKTEASDTAIHRTGMPAVEWEPGTMGRAASDIGIPIVEVEIGGEATATDEYTQLYCRGMEGVLRHLGLLPGVPERSSRQRVMRRHDVSTPAEGLLRIHVSLGARVKTGQLMGMVVDSFGEVMAELRSPADGVLGATRVVAHVSQGDFVFSVFEKMTA